MSKKGTIEVFQTKISRNDRFAQMSYQEKLIEQKKREIQAKLEQKKACKETDNVKSNSTKSTSTNNNKSPVKISTTEKNEKKPFNFNTFSNDGSFLNQFKQMKDKKLDHKLKSFNNSKQGSDRDSDRNNKNKWRKDPTSPTISKDNRNQKSKPSRFNNTEKLTNYEPKISISTSYSNLITQQNFEPAGVTAQDVTGQPLLKNLVSPQQYPPSNANVPIMMNVPPPQIQLHPLPPEITVDLCPTTVITTVALTPQQNVPETTTIITVPPPCLPPLELASIPPPNPIQVHNIPQPEPMNTLTIPPPAPLQVQNIPPPSPIQLNEIPTPNKEPDAEFIKNVPPPNKSVPPPSIADNVPTCLPPPNIMPPTSMPPPQANLNILVAQQVPQVPAQVSQVTQIQLQQLPPPPAVVSIVTQPVPQPIMNPIPALMAQPILPPPTMGIVPPPQINVPPPTLMQQTQIQLPPPVFNHNQQPLIPVNVPPPQIGLNKDANTVFPPGSADYEAMASLGRMVAQCGRGIEDVVRQRKNQDPSLWFLFDKNSAAYRQYQQMVEQFMVEISVDRSDQDDYKPEEIYESDVPGDDCDMDINETSGSSQYAINKRKRKSRWSDKMEPVPPPILQAPIKTPILPSSTGVMLSKITRQDPGFINYVISTYGSTNLNEETWLKAEDNYKVHLVYQEMLKKKQDLERLQTTGRKKYEYDSDEETDGGTWEHKQRENEMKTTQQWAHELTRHADGKHHIGDFLPPEEFKKLFQKDPNDGNQEGSDYSEHKLREDNKGFKMLQKLGWSEGKGLGTTEKGILEPINKGFVSRDGIGLGNQQDGKEGTGADDEYDAYRKRMMLAYKFRPNPLNNPRRAYY